MIDSATCPCCQQPSIAPCAAPYPHRRCPRCLHRWRQGGLSTDEYRELIGRTPADPIALKRKHAERLEFMGDALKMTGRILDIGCAEGLFGDHVKQIFPDVEYVGVEVSRDAELAAGRLDRVHHGTLNALSSPYRFDLVVSFHVLEHLADPGEMLRHIESFLSPFGQLVLEVPCGSGNHVIPWDRNEEHLHFFSPTSLSALATHAGYEVLALASGGFESDVYDNTLRLRARKVPTEAQRETAYRHALSHILGPTCLVYGVGGDFRNWVRPYLDDGHVAAYFDTGAAQAPAPAPGRTIELPDALVHYPIMPILIASYRHQDEIRLQLISEFAIAPERIFTLGMILAQAQEMRRDA